MNAAFLLVTSAWLAGADAAPPAKPATAAPAAAAPAAAAPAANWSGGCGCTSSCGSETSCCEEEGFWGRMKRKFRGHHRGCEDSCNTCNTCNTCSTYVAQSACECDSCGGKHSRFRGFFSKHRGGDDCGCDTGCNSCNGCNGGSYGATGTWSAPATSAPAGNPPARMPAQKAEPIGAPKATKPTTEAPAQELPRGASAAPSLDVTPTSSKQAEETKNPFELDRRYETRVDRAADYSWLTGQLFYVHADGGLWVLRYAPIWKEEANGGSVVLARDVPMDSYREGDLVKVHGEVLQQKASSSLGGPLYRVGSIQLVDRPAR